MFIKMNVAGADGAPGRRIPENVPSMPNMTKQEAAPRDIVILATRIFRDIVETRISMSTFKAQTRSCAFPSHCLI
jgi:hypothetical protein